MAITVTTEDGTLVRPGAYAKPIVQNNPSGTSTTGVIVAVGEAESGPSAVEEGANLSKNVFGPGQRDALVAKYISGPIVDAFDAAAEASNDPNITGSFFRFLPAKTNTSAKASGLVPAIGSGSYGKLTARLGGARSNLITRTLTQKIAETVPSTGSMYIAPPQVTTPASFRVNGGALVSTNIAAATLPPAIVTAIDGLTGVSASGGTDRTLLSTTGQAITVVVDSGFQVHFTSDTDWDNNPTVGDLLYIPTGSPFTTVNEGSYVITAVANARIDAYKILNAAGGGNSLTAPTAEGPITIAATTNMAAYARLVVSVEAGAVVPGLGKSLEFANTGSGDMSDVAFVFDGATASPPASAADFISTSTTPTVITSASEYKVTLNVSRQSDAINQDVDGDGRVVLTLGYQGTTASCLISNGIMTLTVVGGSGTSPAPIPLKNFTTISDLTTYIGSLTGFLASPANAAQGSVSPLLLDEGTYTFATEQGIATGRIKADGARFRSAVAAGSALVTIAPIAPAKVLVGQPDVASIAFLSGGTKGATSNGDVQSALAALAKVRCNFVGTCFSRDASEDIDDALTDDASTYTIASVNAALKSHVLLMSQVKKRRPRQGFASFRGSYADGKEMAGTMAQARVSVCIQDDKDNATSGIVQFQPWHLAFKAAGMQAAGFYRDITEKFINVSGVLQAAGDFDDQDDDQVDDALLSGLLIACADESGGFKWVSDQTTYTRDDNFVFNSIAAVYAVDTIGGTIQTRMEKMFAGQSPADINAQLALTALEGIMADIKKLKLIAASDDAPKGFKKAKIEIAGPHMRVSLEVKLAGSIKFITISFLVTPVQQTAGG
jgi:hypothetical protein